MAAAKRLQDLVSLNGCRRVVCGNCRGPSLSPSDYPGAIGGEFTDLTVDHEKVEVVILGKGSMAIPINHLGFHDSGPSIRVVDMVVRGGPVWVFEP